MKPAEIGAGGSRASFPTEWTDMSKSDIKFVAGLGAAVVAIVVTVWFAVWMVMDQNEYYRNEQKKQDRCIAAGGMWIDNRYTTSYCYFNK